MVMCLFDVSDINTLLFTFLYRFVAFVANFEQIYSPSLQVQYTLGLKIYEL